MYIDYESVIFLMSYIVESRTCLGYVSRRNLCFLQKHLSGKANNSKTRLMFIVCCLILFHP